MPSEKRQRQRENSRARLEAAAAARKRSQQRTRIIAVVVGAVLLGGAIFWASQGGDDGTDVAAGSTTTEAKGATSTTVGGAAGDPNTCPPEGGTEKRFTSFSSKPKMCIDATKKYRALVTTDIGDYTIELDPAIAPETVNSFVFLARNKFYENVIFHRVIPGFMVQGGDPDGNGTGGPGYTIPDEFSTEHKFQVGDVAMAKTPSPNSGGSQFFTVIGPQGESLPAEYTWFGRVVDGLDTVKKIEADGNDDPQANGSPPKVTHKILSITITEG